MNIKTVTITRAQNKMVHELLESHTAAIKNWLASAVESNEQVRAQHLVRELRAYQELFHTFVPDDMWPGTYSQE